MVSRLWSDSAPRWSPRSPLCQPVSRFCPLCWGISLIIQSELCTLTFDQSGMRTPRWRTAASSALPAWLTSSSGRAWTRLLWPRTASLPSCWRGWVRCQPPEGAEVTTPKWRAPRGEAGWHQTVGGPSRASRCPPPSACCPPPSACCPYLCRPAYFVVYLWIVMTV